MGRFRKWRHQVGDFGKGRMTIERQEECGAISLRFEVEGLR